MATRTPKPDSIRHSSRRGMPGGVENDHQTAEKSPPMLEHGVGTQPGWQASGKQAFLYQKNGQKVVKVIGLIYPFNRVCGHCHGFYPFRFLLSSSSWD